MPGQNVTFRYKRDRDEREERKGREDTDAHMIWQKSLIQIATYHVGTSPPEAQGPGKQGVE